MQGVGSYLAMPSIRKPYPHTHGFPARSRAVPRAAPRRTQARAGLPPVQPLQAPVVQLQGVSPRPRVNRTIPWVAGRPRLLFNCGAACGRLRLVVLCLCGLGWRPQTARHSGESSAAGSGKRTRCIRRRCSASTYPTAVAAAAAAPASNALRRRLRRPRAASMARLTAAAPVRSGAPASCFEMAFTQCRRSA